EADNVNGNVQLNLNNPAIVLAANGYSSDPNADQMLVETLGHEVGHLDHNMMEHKGVTFQGQKYSDNNLAAELLDEYSAQYTGIMAATGNPPTRQDMANFWLDLVGRSKNDTSASFYQDLAAARQKSGMFDQVVNDVRSILLNPQTKQAVTPQNLRDRLLNKLYTRGNDVTLDDPSYLESFDSSKLDNKLTPTTNS